MELLFKIFIKDKDNVESTRVRSRYGQLSGGVGIFLNCVLFVIKFIAGILTSSVGVTADAFNNLSDAGSSVLTVVGYTMSGKPADKDHPYGHARMEYLCSLFISVIVMFLGFEMLTSSIDKIVNKQTTEEFSLVAIIVIASTILVKALVAVFYSKLGKKINSSALRASAPSTSVLRPFIS